MSSKKIDRALYGPSFVEVIFGAILSFVLGTFLAAAFLILKPVPLVKVIPKEPVHGMVYYVEGSKDANKGRTWMRKRKALVAGQSVALTEDELNAAFETPGDKAKAAAPAPAASRPGGALFAAGTPNFRQINGALQIGVPCTINLSLLSFSQQFTVVATGGFNKQDDGFVFEPKTYYVGSLAVSRLPVVSDFVTRKILAAQNISGDLTEAWKKLGAVVIETKQLQLLMQ